MKCKLTKLGVLMIPILSIETQYWKAIKHPVGESAMFYHYQIEGPGGFTKSHLDQDEVPDGEYDLPLTIDDFVCETGVREDEY